MSQSYYGACTCRAVQFVFSGPPLFVTDCVCESCRQTHGASAVCWAGVKEPAFHIQAGEKSLSWYRSSAESERGFCMQCGTRILFRSTKWPGEIHIALACVNPPHDLKSTGVCFKGELPVWTALVDVP